MVAPVSLVPAALALLFAAWCGSFGAGSGWLAAAAAYALVLAAAPGVGPRWRDPWRLGSPGHLLLGALLAAVVLAWWTSPVPRSGRVGVALLPAFLWLPAALAHAWGSGPVRRLGARGVSAAVAAVAGLSLGFWLAGVTPRPALPLGHHLYLAAWLALLLPLALLPWREGGAWRWLAGASGALAVAAVLATRSLAGGLALVAEAGLGLLWYAAGYRGAAGGRRRLARAGLLAAVLVLATVALLWSDLAAVVRGTDPSLAARTVYWQAGWAGVTERPALGFGPGSTAWTLPLFLRPVPGVNPPGEVVGELHLLPLAAAYELGVPGLLLAAAAVGLFAWRRVRERSAAGDPLFLAAGLVGLAGGAAAALATAEWRVGALPVAAAVAAGAALAGGGPGGEAAGSRARRAGRLVPGLYALAAAAALLPVVLAHRAYDRAVGAPRDEALRRLERAVSLDPAFPLYRARRGWLEAEDPEGARDGRADSLAAARAALGVGPLWLAAGAAAEASGDRPTAAFAYERACSLDPLGALPPFRLARIGSPLHEATAVAARSVAADPRLAAAAWWRGRGELLERAALQLAVTPGLEQGWRAAVVEAVEEVLAGGPGGGATAELALVFDARPEGSASLHLFRRRPWRARLAPVPVDAGAAAGELARLPAATSLPATDPGLFPPTCTGPFSPQRLRKTLWKSW